MQATPQQQHIQAIRQKFSGEREEVAKLLHNALNVITTTLNACDHHFLLELIQNAEDNSYDGSVKPLLKFSLNERSLIVQNNETGFQRANVDSICNVGASTKKHHKRMGYIGEKGLGFKSVFQVANTVRILSNGYKFSLSSVDDPEIHIPYIIPTWVNMNVNEESNTFLLMILKPEKLAIVKKGLQRLSPESILFLNKLHELHVKILTESTFIVRRDMSRMPLVTLSMTNSRVTYYLNKVTYAVPESVVETRRSGVISREVGIAFPLGKNNIHITGNKRRLDSESGDEDEEAVVSVVNVFAYLPTSIHSGLPFLMNADFLLNSAREILTDPATNRWNRWLLYECIPKCFLDTFESLLFNDTIGDDFLRAYSFIPLLKGDGKNDNSHQQHGDIYFTKIAQKIRDELSKMKIVLVPFPRGMPEIDREGPGVFKLPSECRIGPPNMYEIFGDFEDELGLVDPDIAQYREQLLAIGVQNISPSEILTHIRNPLLFDGKPPLWWLEFFKLLMDMKWTKEDVSGIGSDSDMFLPLDNYNIDALSPRRFFPPELSTIPLFTQHNGNYFIPCLRRDVYNLLKMKSPKILEWMQEKLNVHHLTLSDYCKAYTIYLSEKIKKESEKVTKETLLQATKFLFENVSQLDASTKRFIKTHLPVVSEDDTFILRSLEDI